MPYQQFRRREGNSRGRGRGGRGRPFSRQRPPYERPRSDSRDPRSGSGNQENGTIIQLLQQLTGAVRELQRQPSSERRGPSGAGEAGGGRNIVLLHLIVLRFIDDHLRRRPRIGSNLLTRISGPWSST